MADKTTRPGDRYRPRPGHYHSKHSFARMVAANEAAARGLSVVFDHSVPDWVPEELRHAAGYIPERGWYVLANVNTDAGEILLPAEKEFVPVAKLLEHEWSVDGAMGWVRVQIPGRPSPVGNPQR
ncbi:hypothetical protein [Allosalinactinospora lopnorensis]|uniref:hypothetical protein n=1 Tax=Allosalinactinospora lopnorensis TaxID=1352348 RepID=UPI000623DD44|nr:hypothetical protein [Allosalinactinospora lopnorensis]